MTEQLFEQAVNAYLTQYVGLGIIFFFGLYIAVKQGDIGFKTKRQRRWMFIMLSGYIGYAIFHGFFQLLLPVLER